jgi:hypothetical protein
LQLLTVQFFFFIGCSHVFKAQEAKRDEIDQQVICRLEKLSNCAFPNEDCLQNALTKLSEGVGLALTFIGSRSWCGKWST